MNDIDPERDIDPDPERDALAEEMARLDQAARWAAAVEMSDHMVALLTSKEQAAADPTVRQDLHRQAKEIRRRVRDIEPGDETAVESLLEDWAPQIRAARQGPR